MSDTNIIICTREINAAIWRTYANNFTLKYIFKTHNYSMEDQDPYLRLVG